MSCDCWAAPQPVEHNYLITLVDKNTFRQGRCIMRSTCPHGFQEHAEALAAAGQLKVTDADDLSFYVTAPKVTVVDARGAAHVPIDVPEGEEVTL